VATDVACLIAAANTPGLLPSMGPPLGHSDGIGGECLALRVPAERTAAIGPFATNVADHVAAVLNQAPFAHLARLGAFSI
jgi:hypothetical protein